MGVLLFVLLMLPKAHAEESWGTGTYKKLEAMINLWWKPDTAKQSIIECKALSSDPWACVKVINFVWWPESTGGNNDNYNNVFGVLKCRKNKCSIRKFDSDTLAIRDFIKRGERLGWFKYPDPKNFYGASNMFSYCVHTVKGKNIWCSDWLANSTYANNKFTSFTK
jgi:hypothetical protein